MTRKNLASILACGTLAASLLAAPQGASAGTVTATIPGSNTAYPASGTLGTFTFTIPAGQTATSATVSFSDFLIGTAAILYLDGVLLGPRGSTSADGAFFTLSLTDLSILDDGAAVLSWVLPFVDPTQCNCVVQGLGETLTITTAATPVPEPMTVSLVGTSLLGLGVVRRRRAD